MAAAQDRVTWTASSKNGTNRLAMNQNHSAKLTSGWRCTVGEASINNARETICVKEAEEVQFSVMCMAAGKRDNVQVRLRDRNDGGIDFFEVSCDAQN